MPGISIPALGNTLPNALQQIGFGLAQGQQVMGDMQVAQQATGQKLLQPYITAMTANPALAQDPAWIARVERITKQYGLPLPMIGGGQASAAAASTLPQAAAGAPGAGAGSSAPAPGGTAPQGGFSWAGPPSATQVPLGVVNPGAPEIPGIGPGAQPTPGEAMERKLIADKGNAPGWSTTASGGHAFGQPQPDVAAGSPPVPQGSATQQQPVTDPSHVDSGNVSTIYDKGGPLRIDVNALAGRSLSPNDVVSLLNMDPDGRKAALSAMHYDLNGFSPAFLNAPQNITPAERVSATNQLARDISNLPEGKSTPQALMAQAKLYRGILGNEAVDSVLNDAGTLNQMGQALQVQFQKLVVTGYWKQKDYQLAEGRLQEAIRRGATAQELADIQAQLLPHKIASLDAGAQHAVESLGIENQRLQLEQQKFDASQQNGGFTKQQLVVNYRSALSAFQQAQSQIRQYKSNVLLGMPPPEVMEAAETAAANLQFFTEQAQAAGIPVKNYVTDPSGANMPTTDPATAARNALNNVPGITTVGGHKTPQGWHAQALDRNNKPIGVVNGKWVHQDGTPAG